MLWPGGCCTRGGEPSQYFMMADACRSSPGLFNALHRRSTLTEYRVRRPTPENRVPCSVPAWLLAHLLFFAFICGSKPSLLARQAPGQSAQWSSDTRGEAKKVVPQMNAKNANGPVPKRSSGQVFGFTLARWCVTWKRCVELRYN